MALITTPQLRLFDERFGGKTAQLKHFLVLSQQQLTSTLFDQPSNTYLSLEQYRFQKTDDWVDALRRLEKILPKEEFQNNSGMQVCISDPLYTLVPQALFDEQELNTYLGFNHPLEENSNYKFHFTKLESLEAVIVFAIPRSLEFMLKAKLPPYQLTHFASPILEALGLEKTNNNELLIHVQETHFEVIYVPKGKLQFFNSFQYQSKEDFIYYLLYVMEQLKLEREVTKLVLLGEIEKESAIFKLLYTYIHEVVLGNRPKQVHFSAVLAEVNQHAHFSLFNLHLCG